MVYSISVAGSTVTGVLDRIECVANKPCIAVFYTTQSVSQGSSVAITVSTGNVSSPTQIPVFAGYVYRAVDRSKGTGKWYEVNAVSRIDLILHGFIDASFNETLDNFMNNLLSKYLNNGSIPGGMSYFLNDELTSYNASGRYYGELDAFFDALYAKGFVLVSIPHSDGTEGITLSGRGRVAYEVTEKVDAVTNIGGATGVRHYNCLYVKAWSVVEQYQDQIDGNDNNGTVQLSAIPVGEIKVYVTDDQYTPQFELCKDVDYTIQVDDPETPPSIVLNDEYSGQYLLITYSGRTLYKKKYTSSTGVPTRCYAVEIKDVATSDNLQTAVDDFANKWLATHTGSKERHIYQPTIIDGQYFKMLGAGTVFYQSGSAVTVHGLFNLTIRRWLDAAHTSNELLYVKKIVLRPTGIDVYALPPSAVSDVAEAIGDIGVAITALKTRVTGFRPALPVQNDSGSGLVPI